MPIEKGMEEYLDVYVEEATELLTNLNKALMEFEKNPRKTEALEAIARSAHTLKSSSASMGFHRISELAHKMEDLFNKLKEAKGISSAAGIIDVLFKCFDTLQVGLEKVRRGEDEPDVEPLLKKLSEFASMDLSTMEQMRREPADQAAVKADEEVASGAEGAALAEKPSDIQLVRFVKVDIERLDKLVNLVGEILIAKMRLKNINAAHHIPEFESVINNLDMLIEDLQYEVTEARMIPVGQVFNRFPRMVHDIAKKEGKKVEFTMEGQDMKLDRTILDQLGEPMIHLLRNSVDHGIETPEERKAAGKSETGTVKLVARRERNSAVIEVIDDGAGFDPEAIKKAALKRKFKTKEELDTMSEKELIMLPFLPGFSTSEKVTDVSGRGVGLDVVRTKIEDMNGSVRVETQKGRGCRFILELPLTLSIVKSLLVRIGGEKYAIPIASILRIIRVTDGVMRHIEGNEVLVLDEDKIPVVRLREKFHMEGGRSDRDVVIIVEKGGEKVGFVVDEIIEEMEIMIKPMDKEMKKVKGFAGATILGDGSAALVLDVAGIS